jgi:hypothetical protein
MKGWDGGQTPHDILLYITMEEKIDELLKLTKENNKILHKMHSVQVWAGIFRFIYWAALIGTSVGLWYYFQPTIDKYMSLYNTLMGNITSLTESAGAGAQTLSELLNNPIIKK